MMRKSMWILGVAVLFLSVSAMFFGGCAGKGKIYEGVSGVWFSPDGRVLVERGEEFFICQVDTAGNLYNCNPIQLPRYSGARILTADCTHNRFYYAAEDSVFAYDRTSGLTRTLTRGAFARRARCGRVSPDGKYLAFSASLWKMGNINFWRLVLVDAIEVGIVHYCDSLATPGAFQWVKGGRRLGYAELRVGGPKIDTVGVFFDIKRNVVIPARDGSADFLVAPCDSCLSYDGTWRAVMDGGKLRFERVK